MESPDSIQLARLVLVLSLVAFCCASDLSTRRIPNAALFPALVTALFLNTLDAGLMGLADSAAGLVIGIGMLLPMYLMGRMGAGDLKLLGVVGSILGAWGAIVAGFATMTAGGILGLTYLTWLLGKPALMAHCRRAAALFTRSRTLGTRAAASTQSLRTAEIPYAVAIAAGTVATLVYLGAISEVTIT